MDKQIFTVCTTDRINGALALFDSLKEASFSKFYVFYIGDMSGCRFEVDPRIEFVSSREVIGEGGEYQGKYELLSLTERCCHLKVHALHYMLKLNGDRDVSLLYADSDIYFFDNNLEFMEGSWSVLLTPHLTPDNQRDASEWATLMKSGTYNAGLFVVKAGAVGRAFCDYWINCVNTDCSIDYFRNVNADQKWLDLVPTLFYGVKISNDAGLNLGHWRVDKTDEVSCQGEVFFVGDAVIRCFHFSGYSFDQLPLVSCHSALIAEKGSALRRMAETYSSKMEMYKEFNQPLGFKLGNRFRFTKFLFRLRNFLVKFVV
ncbi:hypothetical protein ACJJIQ_05335 [Microbulbifer sp. ANSA003]|uniref:hypothetical protein n=1 Tax=Microbulbifer sp. ANSA003 TaxID=3243360 RepID=UPI004042AF0C